MMEDDVNQLVWVPMIDAIADSFAGMITDSFAEINKYRQPPLDEFGMNIPCVHQDSDGCDYKLVRNKSIIGYLCREHVDDYVRFIKGLNLNVREVRLERLTARSL